MARRGKASKIDYARVAWWSLGIGGGLLAYLWWHKTRKAKGATSTSSTMAVVIPGDTGAPIGTSSPAVGVTEPAGALPADDACTRPLTSAWPPPHEPYVVEGVIIDIPRGLPRAATASPLYVHLNAPDKRVSLSSAPTPGMEIRLGEVHPDTANLDELRALLELRAGVLKTLAGSRDQSLAFHLGDQVRYALSEPSTYEDPGDNLGDLDDADILKHDAATWQQALIAQDSYVDAAELHDYLCTVSRGEIWGGEG